MQWIRDKKRKRNQLKINPQINLDKLNILINQTDLCKFKFG